MGASQKEAEKVLEAKRKYFEKVLSDEAIDSNIFRMYSIFDLVSFWGDYVLSDTLFSSLISLLFFDIPLSEVVPWTLTWDIELPSVDEFMRGVLIKLEPISILDAFPELADVVETLRKVLLPEYSGNIIETRPRKLIVGESYYGDSYVDPPAVREFLRSTLYAFTKKNLSRAEAKQRLLATVSTLNIAPEVVEDVFNRLSMMEAIKTNAATWDYAWWDVSCWAEEGSGGQVEFTSWDLTTEKVEYEQLWDVEGGGWWDLSYWDMCYWTDDISPYAVTPEGVAAISAVRDFVVESFRRRITATALAVANYQTAEERQSMARSPRTETFAVPFSHRVRLESMTESIVRKLKPDVSPFELRLYKTAVIEMYGKLYGPHRWGAEMERSMSEGEFRSYWLDKWSSEGLDRSVLEQLYSSLRPVVDTLGGVRTSERIRFLREKYRRY